LCLSKARPARPGSNSPCQSQTTSTSNISKGSSQIFPSKPPPDAVLSFYRFVVLQTVDLDGSLCDLEESRAEVERKDVELDKALQARESSVYSLEMRVKSLQEEIAKVKEERNTFGKSVATLLRLI
jgi:hypothetical protein